jgi:hypothetical protein
LVRRYGVQPTAGRHLPQVVGNAARKREFKRRRGLGFCDSRNRFSTADRTSSVFKVLWRLGGSQMWGLTRRYTIFLRTGSFTF